MFVRESSGISVGILGYSLIVFGMRKSIIGLRSASAIPSRRDFSAIAFNSSRVDFCILNLTVP
jgi:hypothetical protein